MLEHDRETKEILSEADHVKNMISSDGWNIVKVKLDAKILDLQNISNIDMAKPETLSIQLAARTLAVALIWEWLKDDVYGFIEQQEANNQKPKPQEENYIDRG